MLAERVGEEFEEIVNGLGIRKVFVSDEDFFISKERVAGICDEIRRRGLNVLWRCFARATDISLDDMELLHDMRDSGCVGLFIGIESCSEATLRNLNKGTTVARLREAFEAGDRAGMIMWGSLMCGYPWESEAELLESLETVKQLACDYVYATFLTPFPGTELYDYCVENDLLLTHDLAKFDCCSPVIRCPIAPDRLRQIRDSFERERLLYVQGRSGFEVRALGARIRAQWPNVDRIAADHPFGDHLERHRFDRLGAGAGDLERQRIVPVQLVQRLVGRLDVPGRRPGRNGGGGGAEDAGRERNCKHACH